MGHCGLAHLISSPPPPSSSVDRERDRGGRSAGGDPRRCRPPPATLHLRMDSARRAASNGGRHGRRGSSEKGQHRSWRTGIRVATTSGLQQRRGRGQLGQDFAWLQGSSRRWQQGGRGLGHGQSSRVRSAAMAANRSKGECWGSGEGLGRGRGGRRGRRCRKEGSGQPFIGARRRGPAVAVLPRSPAFQALREFAKKRGEASRESREGRREFGRGRGGFGRAPSIDHVGDRGRLWTDAAVLSDGEDVRGGRGVQGEGDDERKLIDMIPRA